jgi:hypothetical protein
MNRFMYNLGIAILYVILTFVLAYINVDFVCGFNLVCDADNSEQQAYLLTGQLIMFLNLWMLYFFVNVNFFRDGDISGRQLVWPAITSTLLAAILFVTAIYVMTVVGVAFLILTGIGLR